jgi:predicted dehydrogenase
MWRKRGDSLTQLTIMERREFFRTGISSTLGFGAGLTILANASSARGAAANEKINLALVGCGPRGTALLHGFESGGTHVTGFQDFEDVNVLYCCDVQKDRAERAAARANAKYAADMRTILDDKSVDAVVYALPTHWHSLATILTCQAGKDVFTEKPSSHSAWEGQKMVEAARKYKRIVQHGTQSRSAAYNKAARKYIEDGKLGKIHFVRVYNMKEVPNFNLDPNTTVPDGIDWDRWLGPAPMRPYSSSYTGWTPVWHHIWDFSCGDMMGDGIHQLDIACMLIGKQRPKSAYCVGGLFNSQGDAETPDTQVATWEFDDMVMTLEVALYTPYMLKIDAEARQSDIFPYWLQCATRIEIYGSEGLMVIGRQGGGWQVFVRPSNRQPVVRDSMHGRYPEVEHKRNFIDCIRTRELPDADIEIGNHSTTLVHYATISYRLGGEKLLINQNDGTIVGNPGAAKYWKREYRAPYIVPEEV